jgi:hypothetical protein
MQGISATKTNQKENITQQTNYNNICNQTETSADSISGGGGGLDQAMGALQQLQH